MYSENSFTRYNPSSNITYVEMLDLPDPDELYEHINTEPLPVSLNKDVHVVQKLKYCYANRIPFTERMGLKAINAAVNRLSLSKEDSAAIKEWYESEGMKPYSSGEYPVPANFQKWVILDNAIFSEDCASFIVDRNKRDFKNNLEKEEHQKAIELYMEKHYIGSDEEAKDLAKIEEKKREDSYREAQAVANEIRYLEQNLEFIIPLPEGCSIVNKKSYVGLQLDTCHGYIAAHENGLYEMFDNQTVKYGVLYKVCPYYHGLFSWDFNTEDPYNLAVESLKSSFQMIDDYNGNISEKTMKILKENLKDKAQRLLNHYMNKRIVSEKENFALKQMVEDYFGTKGIEAKIIQYEPIIRQKIDWGYFADDKEYEDDDD